ncbi:AAA family ATPase [Grimontia sp. SpTr1]|uniref:ATP-dependent nuclease n=1 Tax=Grimontia sp. SpTr1 TaxID=2995319 RepID=UPI00248CF00E|nr:AAA family ATPase [Grimontia sp. SpTr1]
MFRSARIGDSFRKLQYSKYTSGLEYIESEKGQLAISENKIEVDKTLVLFGLNGSGKTQLLKELSKGNDSLGNIKFKAKDNSEFYYFSPSELVVSIKNSIENKTKNFGRALFEEKLNEYTPLILAEDEIKKINYILATDFSEILVYELEAEQPDEPEIPYFITTDSSGDVRCTSNLSHGEKYIITLVWFLKYKNESSLLFDEPETYLYPAAQKRLIEVLVILMDPYRNQIIVATHSKDVIKALRIAKIVNITKFRKNEFLINDDYEDNASIMGIIRPVTLLMVEDAKSRAFLDFIRDEFNLDDRIGKQSIIISAKNGFGDINKIYSSILDFDGFSFSVILDNDLEVKGEIPKNLESISLTLPGKMNPEYDILEVINRKRENFVSAFQSEHQYTVAQFLQTAIVCDDHDFFVELSKLTEIKEFDIFKIGFQIWLEDADNRRGCENFIRQLESNLQH